MCIAIMCIRIGNPKYSGWFQPRNAVICSQRGMVGSQVEHCNHTVLACADLWKMKRVFKTTNYNLSCIKSHIGHSLPNLINTMIPEQADIQYPALTNHLSSIDLVNLSYPANKLGQHSNPNQDSEIPEQDISCINSLPPLQFHQIISSLQHGHYSSPILPPLHPY